MKTTVRLKPLFSISLIIFSLLLLGGCVASKKDKFMDDQMAKGVKPLTAVELKEVLSDSTLYLKHPTKYEGKMYYSADGTSQGKVWGSWGDATSEGNWYVKDEGVICEKWGPWGGKPHRGENCYEFYPGDGPDKYTSVRVSGPASKNWPDGIRPIKITKGKSL